MSNLWVRNVCWISHRKEWCKYARRKSKLWLWAEKLFLIVKIAYFLRITRHLYLILNCYDASSTLSPSHYVAYPTKHPLIKLLYIKLTWWQAKSFYLTANEKVTWHINSLIVPLTISSTACLAPLDISWSKKTES